MTKKAVVLGILVFVASFGVGSSITFVIQLVRRENAPENHKVLHVPSIRSSVSTVEVINSLDVEASSPDMLTKVNFLNRSDKAIIAFTVESGNERDSDASSQVRPVNLIAGPNEEFTVAFPLTNFSTGENLRLSAVVFADGTAEGETEAKTRLLKSIEENSTNIRRDLFH